MVEETKAPVARCVAHAPLSLELPAPVCVCGLLVVAALTKGGHSQSAIGGMMFLYLLYLAAQYARWGRRLDAASSDCAAVAAVPADLTL